MSDQPKTAGAIVVGPRERFQKWVLSTEHAVYGWLDGHWLRRGDDRKGYANEYVQGLWVAFKAFSAPADHVEDAREMVEPPPAVAPAFTDRQVLDAIYAHGQYMARPDVFKEGGYAINAMRAALDAATATQPRKS